ncbi:MAG: hypothetical protein IJ394_03140 [Bacteroidales bacterium]|nr:hypothetical protein [Bacteroidales bacterium]
MKKYVNVLSVLLLALCCVSCHMFAPGQPSPTRMVLLTGECLNATEMSNSGSWVRDGKIDFRFEPALSSESDRWGKNVGDHYRYIPDEGVFESYGQNKTKVKEAYDELFESVANSCSEQWQKDDFSVVTIMYEGGLSLTANKDFAGIPAGEDLSSLVVLGYGFESMAGGFLDIPLGNASMLEDYLNFSIPTSGFEVTEESVGFELNIPVKVVMYLDWLNDRLSDSDAQVSYRDEVLHCKFSTDFGLR